LYHIIICFILLFVFLDIICFLHSDSTVCLELSWDWKLFIFFNDINDLYKNNFITNIYHSERKNKLRTTRHVGGIKQPTSH